MKLIHLSDLHIGKRVNDYSMIDDQAYILKEILTIIDSTTPDGVIIAGDVYDKSVPSAEAVSLLDDFLVKLSKRGLPVFIISGNHDSCERLAFASRLIEGSGIHISPVYNGNVEPITLKDENGEVCVYMLPFVKPIHVHRVFDDESINSYTDALRVAIEHMEIDKSKRNVLITHQFVTGASRTESEELSVGGTDNVDASVFDDFDYVALGHIHRPQNCVGERIRYSGTPLKYSFSEVNDKKSVTVVELGKKGELCVDTIPLTPMRDMVEIRGKYEEITLKSFYDGTSYTQDYVHITLTDEDDIVDAIGKLRAIYHNLMRLDYDNARTRSSASLDGVEDVERKSPEELFAQLYEEQNGSGLSDSQLELLRKLIEKVWEGEK
ncbi:MAG: exonuclease SbcCD subunit D [Clostridia bacterium]|nr:exonuclease SbcCD subunit D [Clostridia bacterium]